MRRAYTFLLCPTVRQAVAFGMMLDDHRALYNAALQERRDAYRHPSKTRIRYGDQSAQVKDLRVGDHDQARWSFSSQQATLRRLERAFAGFFRRAKAGGVPGYPRFKGAGWFGTVQWPSDGDGCRWDSQPEHPTRTFVRLQGIGHVKVHQDRRVLGKVRTVSVKREGRRWYVILFCDDVPAQPLPPTGVVVGVDVGIASFLTTSNGEHEPNPTCLDRSAGRLAAAQRALSRTKRGSVRRRKAAARVGTISRRVARQRLDHTHKTARRRRGRRPLYLLALRGLRACRRGEPAHPGRVRLRAVRAYRGRGRERRRQHSSGRACPSG